VEREGTVRRCRFLWGCRNVGNTTARRLAHVALCNTLPLERAVTYRGPHLTPPELLLPRQRLPTTSPRLLASSHASHSLMNPIPVPRQSVQRWGPPRVTCHASVGTIGACDVGGASRAPPPLLIPPNTSILTRATPRCRTCASGGACPAARGRCCSCRRYNL
jgi:hypothetical protein